MQRVIEIALAVAILSGAVFLWRSTTKRSVLTREHERLADKVGRLQIKDPSKIHIQAIKTGDPLHFAWRAYFPPNYRYAYTCSSGGGSGSMDSAWEGILRVRVREVNGQMLLYYRLQQGSGQRSFGSRKFAEFFKEHREQVKELQAEQLGADGLAVFDPSEVKTLIKISLPEELLPEAKKRLNDWEYNQLVPKLEWIRIGPEGFPEREREGAK